MFKQASTQLVACLHKGGCEDLSERWSVPTALAALVLLKPVKSFAEFLNAGDGAAVLA
jgi:hypothetical protein